MRDGGGREREKRRLGITLYEGGELGKVWGRGETESEGARKPFILNYVLCWRKAWTVAIYKLVEIHTTLRTGNMYILLLV